MVDPWTGPTPTPQDSPHNEPNGIRKLLDKIKALELQVKESTSNLLGTAGIRLTQLGMFIDSSLTVGGSLATTGATTIGGTLGVTGPTTLGAPTTVSGSLGVSGPMTVSGTLSLPAGIIGNDALTSPVAVDNASGASNGMVINVADTDLATASISVPAGYSQALVFIEVTTAAVNNTAAFAFLYISAVVNGVATRLMSNGASPSNGMATVATAKSVTLTGLSGGTISVAARVRCDNGWAANASNRVYSETIVVFLR